LIEFTVFGNPRPQGSKTVFRGRVVDSAKGLKEWRNAIAIEAAKQDWFTDEPVNILIHFYMPRPKTVKRLLPSVPPDLDKLIRGVGDALTGVVIKDDAQIVEISAKKEYGVPGAWIQVTKTF
jgi:Holliday junction resolvase RusA-like endonuclease